MPDTDGGTASAKTGASIDPGEQEELERLRAELATLRSQPPPPELAVLGLIELLGRPPAPRCRPRARAAEAG